MRKDTITVRRISSTEEFLGLKESWTALLSESGSYSAFLRWQWLWNWWEVYKEDTFELCVLVAEKNGKVVGIAPFYTKTVSWKGVYPLKRLMFLGTSEGAVTSEYMDIVTTEADGRAVTESFFDRMTRDSLCDDMVLQCADSGSSCISVLRDLAKEKGQYLDEARSKSPYILLPASYDELLKSLSPSLRRKISSGFKRAEVEDMRFRRTSDIAELDGDIGELVRLQRLRWEPRGMNFSLADGKFLEFQKLAIRELFETGLLELGFLSIDGRNYASVYNIHYNGKVYFYQSGLDTSYDKKLSPGTMLHAHSIKNAIDSGVKEYDFLLEGNTDSYKGRWANRCRHQSDLYIARSELVKAASVLKETARGVYRALGRPGRRETN